MNRKKNNLLNLEETGIPPPPKSQSRQFARLGKADTVQNWSGCQTAGRWGTDRVLLVKTDGESLFLFKCTLPAWMQAHVMDSASAKH